MTLDRQWEEFTRSLLPDRTSRCIPLIFIANAANHLADLTGVRKLYRIVLGEYQTVK